MNKTSRALGNGILICLALAACQNQSTDQIAITEHNELGITRIHVDHRSEKGDRILEIRALDDSGDELAIATLRTGDVLYSPEPDVMPAQWSPGTELMVSAGADTVSFVTPDREAHAEVEPNQSTLAGFVRLSAVSAEIAKEAGIRFTPRSGDGEVALIAQNCNGGNFPTANGNPSSCCVDGATIYHKIASGSNLNKLAWRSIGSTCTTSAGSTNCTGAGCNFGPCGARVNTVTGTNTTAAAVFTPTSVPTACGADGNGSAAAGAIEFPEAFTGSQALKPGVTATCPFTDCNLLDGRPGPGFWLTLTATCVNSAADGTVTWTDFAGAPHSVSCDAQTMSATQTFWANSTGTKSVTAGSSPYGWTEWTMTGTGCTQTSCAGAWTTNTAITGTFCDGIGCAGGGGGGGGGPPGCTFCPDEN